jgi:hypothetical protein
MRLKFVDDVLPVVVGGGNRVVAVWPVRSSGH